MLSSRWISYFLKMAQETSYLSYAERLKVGCVIIKDKRVILCGFNGRGPNQPNECEDSQGKTLSSVLHAEENAILFAAKEGIKLNNTQLFITHSPCIHCARMIYGSGISEVYYQKDYRSDEGLLFLKELGVPVYQIQ